MRICENGVYRDATAEEEQELLNKQKNATAAEERKLTEQNQTKGKQALTAEERLDAMEKRITELEKQLQTEKK